MTRPCELLLDGNPCPDRAAVRLALLPVGGREIGDDRRKFVCRFHTLATIADRIGEPGSFVRMVMEPFGD